MAQAISPELLAGIKNALDITWTDEATDQKISTHIALGMAYLDNKLGEPGEYETPGFPRLLLIEYARYARDAALDVFENNYMSLILAMQNKRRVERHVESAEPTEQGDQPDL